MSEVDGAATAETTEESNGGPLQSLYDNRYISTFLQYPLNLESAEENHWVRFDIQELLGKQIKKDEARTTGVGVGGKSFLDRIVENTAERTSALVTTALLAPINIAKSVVNEFLNDLGPVLGGVGRELLGNFGGLGRSRGNGSIMLYSPHNRVENMKYNWKNESIGQTGQFLENVGGNLRKAITTAKTNETLRNAIANKGVLAEQLLAIMGGGAVNNQTLAEINLRGKGLAINPHIEMFFQNIDFRTFTFDFKLAPRNAPEARAIQEIVQLFKYASAPAFESGPGGIYFVYPNVFDIQFFNEDETHKIAQSALTGIAVNYTAAGVNSTFYDKYPVETQLSLTFTELEIMHKSKIDAGF